MKKFFQLSFVAIALFTGTYSFAQCDPDTSCKDVALPGEFCPKILPEGTVNVPYDTIITVIPPGVVETPMGTATIDHIVVDSVGNLPAGITYEANAEEFYADSAYCIRLSGTPTEAYHDTLDIYVTPYLKMGMDVIPFDQVHDDTSVVMIVRYAAGLDPTRAHEFKVLPNVPNPFFDVTRFGFYTPRSDKVELRIYNILGEMVYWETQGFSPGDHQFLYDGNGLQPGTYFYRVSCSSGIYTGKCIKARR